MNTETQSTRSSMSCLLLKFAISAVVIVAVAEVAKRGSFAGGLLASLPLTSLLAFFWLWHDTHDAEKIAALSRSVFWLVLPSLVLFPVLPSLLMRGVNFPGAMACSVAAMLAAYGLMAVVLGKLGIKL